MHNPFLMRLSRRKSWTIFDICALPDCPYSPYTIQWRQNKMYIGFVALRISLNLLLCLELYSKADCVCVSLFIAAVQRKHETVRRQRLMQDNENFDELSVEISKAKKYQARRKRVGLFIILYFEIWYLNYPEVWESGASRLGTREALLGAGRMLH